MADPADYGSAVEEQQRQDAIDRARRRDLPLQQIDPDTLRPVCLDCGGEIPAARLRVQPRAARCIECQKEHEGGR